MESHINASMLCPIISFLKSHISRTNTRFLHDNGPLTSELLSGYSLVASCSAGPNFPIVIMFLIASFAQRSTFLHLLRLLGIIFLNQLSFLPLPFQLPATLTQGHPKGKKKKVQLEMYTEISSIFCTNFQTIKFLIGRESVL